MPIAERVCGNVVTAVGTLLDSVPSLARDIACLESIQRRTTLMVAGFRDKPYKERLRLLGLKPENIRKEKIKR
jgi:hypothetical protein